MRLFALLFGFARPRPTQYASRRLHETSARRPSREFRSDRHAAFALIRDR